MAKLNPNYSNVPESYLFSQVAKKTTAFQEANPGIEILKLGIGNTTEALVPAIIEGLKRGVEKLSNFETYTGYGDEQGNTALREAVASFYSQRGISLEAGEVFISDGAKTDLANLPSIFSPDSAVGIVDPVYPAYVDSNLISGKRVVYLKGSEENNFIPEPPKEKVDIIYLCFPNNPTGAVASREQLKGFVDYALENSSVIIFDGAYCEYIQDQNLPRSIYEIDGGKRVAIEVQSLSKSAGFTGVRLGWTIVPKELMNGEVNKLWNRRQTTMFNGASNIAQEGALAYFSSDGQTQTKEQVNYYMGNAHIIREGLANLGLKSFGGNNAPYIWVKCPNNLSSWEFFDKLLQEAHVVCTPGVGFGEGGEGYVRLSAFGHRENIEKAAHSIKENLKL